MYDNLDKENKKIESLLEKPPLTTQFIEKEMILIVQLYIVLMVHFNYYKQVLPI